MSLLSLADFKLPSCLSDCFLFRTPLPGRFEEEAEEALVEDLALSDRVVSWRGVD